MRQNPERVRIAKLGEKFGICELCGMPRTPEFCAFPNPDSLVEKEEKEDEE